MLKCNIPTELVSFPILGQIPDKSISRRKEFILAHWWGGQVTIAGAVWIHGVDRSPLQGHHGCTRWRGHHRWASMGARGGEVTNAGTAWVHGVDRSPQQGQPRYMVWRGHHCRGGMEDGKLGSFCWHEETERKAGTHLAFSSLVFYWFWVVRLWDTPQTYNLCLLFLSQLSFSSSLHRYT